MPKACKPTGCCCASMPYQPCRITKSIFGGYECAVCHHTNFIECSDRPPIKPAVASDRKGAIPNTSCLDQYRPKGARYKAVSKQIGDLHWIFEVCDPLFWMTTKDKAACVVDFDEEKVSEDHGITLGKALDSVSVTGSEMNVRLLNSSPSAASGDRGGHIMRCLDAELEIFKKDLFTDSYINNFGLCVRKMVMASIPNMLPLQLSRSTAGAVYRRFDGQEGLLLNDDQMPSLFTPIIERLICIFPRFIPELVLAWGAAIKDSNTSSLGAKVSSWFAEKRTVHPSEYWWGKSDYQSYQSSLNRNWRNMDWNVNEEVADITFTVWHAFNFVVLGLVDFIGNDRERRRVSLRRQLISAEAMSGGNGLGMLPVGRRSRLHHMPLCSTSVGSMPYGSQCNAQSFGEVIPPKQRAVFSVPHHRILGCFFVSPPRAMRSETTRAYSKKLGGSVSALFGTGINIEATEFQAMLQGLWAYRYC